jgi:tripartite-type tricarboxylate transporter receptor subunit TctC
MSGWEDSMKLSHRRQLLHLAAGAAALPAVSRFAWAQAYPSRRVRIVVGFPAGSGIDRAAHIVGEWLAARLGQSFDVENRLGAGTNNATEAVVRAPSDGYTLLLANTANAINATLYDKLNFDFIRDTTPVAGVVSIPIVMVVNPSFPAKTVPELVAYAKANPGKVTMASPFIGTLPHLAAAWFKATTGVDMPHVTYPGDVPALNDLVAGKVQLQFSGLGAAMEYIKPGKLRALAVTTATRAEYLPDIPTVGDFLPGYAATTWLGISAPKNTSVEIVERLNKEINAALADTKLRAQFAELGHVPMPMTPAEFGKFVAAETEKWGRVVRSVGVKPN